MPRHLRLPAAAASEQPGQPGEKEGGGAGFGDGLGRAPAGGGGATDDGDAAVADHERVEILADGEDGVAPTVTS